MNHTQVTYSSEFLPDVQISVVFSDYPQYSELVPLFKEYGYGFMVPNKDIILIDGEQIVDNFDYNVLKFIEAHEISHVLMNHDGPRSENDELDADLGAFILLNSKDYIDSIDILKDQFENRHGIVFDEKLLDRVKRFF